MILQEIGQALDTPDDIIFDWLQEVAYPDQPMGRSDPRPGRAGARVFARRSRRLRRRALPAGADDPRRRRRGRPRRDHAAGRGHLRPSRARARRSCWSRPASSAASGASSRRSNRCISPSGSRARATATTRSTPPRSMPARSAAACRRGCSRRSREKRGLCYTIYAQAGAYSDTGMLTIYAGTCGRRDRRRWRADHRRAETRRRRHDRGRGRPGPGADEGGAADGAGKRLVAGRTAGAAGVDLGPGDPAGRDRRQDRRGRPRPGARLRREAWPAAAGRRWRSTGRSRRRAGPRARLRDRLAA